MKNTTKELVQLTKEQKEILRKEAQNWLKAKPLFAKYEKQIEKAKKTILDIIGTDTTLSFEDFLFNTSITYQDKCSLTDLKEGDFDIYQKYLKKSPRQNFNITEINSAI